nr:pilus assembly protein PilM [Bacilli bacterium]
MQQIDYALDIGTRSVTGIVYQLDKDNCQVLAVHNIEHKNRAMQDGQIHDIEEVSDVIVQVTKELESQIGQPLPRVSVAAAGRALQTITVQATVPMVSTPFTASDVFNLQLVALQKAQEELTRKKDASTSYAKMHCVGYSVREYYLDGTRIGSLTDQQGQEAAIDIIATFLPRVVIDSLDRALLRAGLTMGGLTLEPIAALHALIPASMRKLNIALVDIGAGTSDIAITAEGTILAYGMVPIAGDEITESLSQAYLLDFKTAESLKRELTLPGKRVFHDILGNRHTLTGKKITESIRHSIESLATHIAQEILKQNNGKTPSAVMIIGGGAKTPLIESLLAENLGLTPDRVRIRNRASISNVVGCEEQLEGSEAVTPIGIALASSFSEITPITVNVKGTSTRLFAFHPLTVGDALLEAGVDVRDLKAKPGSAIVVEVNGQIRSVRGTLGKHGYALRNGEPVELAELLSATDVIDVVMPEHGLDAKATLQDVINEQDTMTITINDKDYSLESTYLINGNPSRKTTVLHDRDQIVSHPISIGELLVDHLNLTLYHSLTVQVNDRPITITQSALMISPKQSLESLCQNGMNITITEQDWITPTIKEVLQQADIKVTQGIIVTLNGLETELVPTSLITKNGVPCSGEDTVADGDIIDCTNRETKSRKEPMTMSHVLLHMGDQFTRQASIKNKLILRQNGTAVDFTTEIADGDQLEIFFQEIEANNP